MTIDEITDKIIESKNNDIAKAFTMHIGSLLLNNGIVPVMTEYTGKDVKNITGINGYKFVMEYGVAFNELDCSKHYKEVYNKAIDDFAGKFKTNYRFEYLGCWDKIVDEIAEQLKVVVDNEQRNSNI